MGKIKTTHIKQLTGSNYPRWKLEVSTALEAESLWGHCSGSTPRPNESQEEDFEEWERNDAQVLACILPLLDDRQYVYVNTLKTAKEIWDKLKNMHDTTAQINQEETQAKFFCYKIKDKESLVQGMEEIEKLAAALAELNVPQSDSAIISRVLTALPRKYDNFKMAWDSAAQADKTRENLYMRLKKIELSNKENEGEDQNPQ